MATAQSVSFETTLSAFGNDTGIEVPAELIPIRATLTADDTPRAVEMPAEFAAALDGQAR